MNNMVFIKFEVIVCYYLRGSFGNALDFQSDVHEFNPPMGKLFSILQGFYAFLLLFCFQNPQKCQQMPGFGPCL